MKVITFAFLLSTIGFTLNGQTQQSGTLKVSWVTDSAHDQAREFRFYKRSGNAPNYTWAVVATFPAPEVDKTIPNLSKFSLTFNDVQSQYTFAISAVAADGSESAMSEPYTFLPAPKGLRVEVQVSVTVVTP